MWRSVGRGSVLLVMLTVLAYLPSLQGGFIWDDDDHFTENPAMQSGQGLQRIWSSLAVSRYYPLTLTNFWLQRRLWDLNPMPYHLVNVLLHALNGLLLFLILRRLRVGASWWVAALWVLHPVNVESVAWVTELKNIQAGAFFFGAVLCYLRFEEEGHRRWYAWAVLLGLGAVLSKPSAVVLPAVLLLCIWWVRRSWRWNDVVRTAPFFLMALGMSALTVIEQQRHITASRSDEWSLGMAERCIIAGKAIWFYAATAVWPFNLAFVYPRWEIDAGTIGSWVPLAGVVTVGGLLWVRRRQLWAQAGFFGLGYFVVALSPVLGFFGVYYFRYSFVADHFQYLASVGVTALTVSIGVTVLRQAGRVGVGAGVTVLLLFGVCTWNQTYVYRNNEALWVDTVAKNPTAWIAHNNLGNILQKRGKTAEAIALYQEALRLKPDHAKAYSNLGIAFATQGKTVEAIAHYQKAVHLQPNDPAILNNLAWALATSPEGGIRDGTVAVQYAERACQLTGHRDPRPLGTLSAAYAEDGRFAEAIKTADQAVALAREGSNLGLVATIEEFLQLYHQGRPYRQGMSKSTERHQPVMGE